MGCSNGSCVFFLISLGCDGDYFRAYFVVQAQVLVDFWLENYKVQVEARSGLLHVGLHGKSDDHLDLLTLIETDK
jgi:hypothetical protein